MSLIPSGQIPALEAVASGLWDTFQKPIIIVKKALISATNENVGFMPGYGPIANDVNYTSTPQSGIFSCLRVPDRPAGEIDAISNKAVSTESLFIKVQQEAHDYITNGETEHAIFLGKTYNITSQDEVTFFLGRTYYYFKLELTN